MADKTGIAWTDATWNPVTGCTKVSPGCAHCYAEALSKRFGRSFEVTLHPERLDEPLHWRKPRRIFVCSMADLFHEDVPDEFIVRVFDAIRGVSYIGHTFQILTKRPERMADIARRLRFDPGTLRGPHRTWLTDNPEATDGYPLLGGNGASGMHGVWLGTSIENDRFAYRADALRSLPRHPNGRRFVSAEPLLGPLVHRCETCGGAGGTWSAAGADPCEAHCNQGWHGLDLTGIDWLIIGGESGPHARPMDPQWVRDLIVKARAAGTAVFVKQMGGLRPGGPIPDEFDIREYPR